MGQPNAGKHGAADAALLGPTARCANTLRKYYLPAAAAYQSRMANKCEKALKMVDWQSNLNQKWAALRFGEMQLETEGDHHIYKVEVYLDDLDPNAVLVELYADGGAGGTPVRQELTRISPSPSMTGGYVYSASVPSSCPIADFAARVIPRYDGMAIPLENTQILMATMMSAQFLNDTAAIAALADGRHGDPFAVLGPHETPIGIVVRSLLPGARKVELLARHSDAVIATMRPVYEDILFEARLTKLEPYRLKIDWNGIEQITEDPYSFAPLLSYFDLHLLEEGKHRDLAGCLGARLMTIDEVPGVRFAVWAPNARRVSVVGDFNSWDGRRHPMRLRHNAGVWNFLSPGLALEWPINTRSSARTDYCR